MSLCVRCNQLVAEFPFQNIEKGADVPQTNL